MVYKFNFQDNLSLPAVIEKRMLRHFLVSSKTYSLKNSQSESGDYWNAPDTRMFHHISPTFYIIVRLQS